jgi:long-subunit acyl-CoA synthetase (AMP-forming)
MSAGTRTWPLRCDGAQLIGDFAVEVRLVSIGASGEIQLRGHNVMEGYWSLPEATADAVASDWFLTGDIGRVDEEGYFYIVARKKF